MVNQSRLLAWRAVRLVHEWRAQEEGGLRYRRQQSISSNTAAQEAKTDDELRYVMSPPRSDIKQTMLRASWAGCKGGCILVFRCKLRGSKYVGPQSGLKVHWHLLSPGAVQFLQRRPVSDRIDSQKLTHNLPGERTTGPAGPFCGPSYYDLDAESSCSR